MTRNGTKNETLTTRQEPFLESFSQMGMKCLEAVLKFWKGKCTAMDKVGAIRDITDILSSASSPPPPCSPILNLTTRSKHISRFLSSMSDLLLQLDPAVWNDQILHMLQGLGKSELSHRLSILRFLKGRRLMKRTSHGPSKRCSPAQCSQMNLQSLPSSPLCLRHNFPTLNGPSSSSGQWSTLTMSYQEVLPSPMTIEKLKLLVTSSSNLAW